MVHKEPFIRLNPEIYILLFVLLCSCAARSNRRSHSRVYANRSKSCVIHKRRNNE